MCGTQSRDLCPQFAHFANPLPAQALARRDTQFAFREVQQAAVLWHVAELDAKHQTRRHLPVESSAESR